MKYLLCSIALASASYADECTKASPGPVDLQSYYEGTDSLTGQELKQSLNDIIKDHKAHQYTPCVWEILEEADEDTLNDSNIIGFYTRRSIPKSRKDQGGNDSDSWNREHIWAKSHGFKERRQHAFSDAHHLRATDKSVNSDRSDNDFDNGGARDSECFGCREGNGTWEAPDVVKGDIARMMFYMDTRYDGQDNSGTPNLQLVNQRTDSNTPKFGKLCTLIEWHLNDPVDTIEQQRNNVVYDWQGNRNPFIDQPEYAIRIWGNDCGISEGDNRSLVLNQIDKVESELKALRTLIEDI